MVYSLNGIRFLKNRRIGDLYSKINKLQVFLPKLLGKKKSKFQKCYLHYEAIFGKTYKSIYCLWLFICICIS